MSLVCRLYYSLRQKVTFYAALLYFKLNFIAMPLSIQSVRKDYQKRELLRMDLPSSPDQLLQSWLDEASSIDPEDYNAMCLSTIGADGAPQGRIVLLRSMDKTGIRFFTNYESDKGKGLAIHPQVCLTFYWKEMERQVRISGVAERISTADSDAYFASRPRLSQIGSWASDQSRPVSNESLESRMKAAEERFLNLERIPRPPHWGGYHVNWRSLEFWQGRPSRLHHRWKYEKNPSGWSFTQLDP